MLPRIDRYEISEEIGHGGMATVYRARDSRLDRWVAVKVMHPHLRGTAQARARFSREARAVAKLHHPAILEIYDYSGNESEDAYIATELLTGPTLRSFVEGVGEIPAEIAACIGVELAEALEAAHTHGIIHRDVKPENVLLHERRVIKLTDFGIADMLDPSVSAMTATGQLLGSPAHMAPEQVEGGDADLRSDIFGLGTILYWLATGNLPFSGKNPHQILKRVVDCNPIDPLVARPSIGRPLRDVIMRCLAKEARARFASARELAAALSGVLEGVGIADPHATLVAYLSNPASEAEALRCRVLAELLRDAKQRVQARDRLGAIESLNRALALDDGNREALELLAALDRASRRRVVFRLSLGLVGATFAAALWVAFAPKSGAVSRNESRVAAPMVAEVAPVERPAPVEPPSSPASGGAADAGLESPVLPPAERIRPPPRPRPRSQGPRTVVFDPEPANVMISVDGAEAKPFGPSFRMVSLAPGRHRFRFIGAHGCCKDREITLDVPPGPGQTVVSAQLEFREARLYVVTDVPADVSVGDGLAKGRTRALINVPITRSLIEKHSISVTAPGRQAYTGTVQLRAGKVTQHNIDLFPSALPSAPR